MSGGSCPIPADGRSKARKSPAARKPKSPTSTEPSISHSACEATVTKPGFADQHVALSESADNPVKLELATASDRVVVTATGAPVPVEDAGVAADVFTAKDFEPVRGAFVQNLLRDVPGLSVVQTGRNGGITSVFARGGESDSALVLLDGIPLTEPGGGLDFAHLTSPGLGRMEVIRGPESVLFGAEASSAVIQMFTERGDPEATAAARVSGI